VIVAIRLHNQHSNNFLKEQQQNAKWSELAHFMCSFPAFPVGSPSKGVNYTPSVLRGQGPQAGLWLLTRHITNIILILRAAGRKSGLGGSDIEDCHDGGRGASSSVLSEA